MATTCATRRPRLADGNRLLLGLALAAAAITAEAQEPARTVAEHPTSTVILGSGMLMPAVPQSLVHEGAEWTVYSRLVNSHLCVSLWGDEVWLGTEMGVKAVDLKRRTVRHYTAAEGLPQNAIRAIFADRSAVWCLSGPTRAESGPLSVCYLDRRRQRWQVVGSAAPFPTSPELLRGVGAPVDNISITANKKTCFLAQSASDQSRTPPPRAYDREARRWRDLHWDPVFAADHPRAAITWAHADEEALWLGTDSGLLSYQLGRKQWRRYLPDQFIYAATADQAELWTAGYRAPRGAAKAAWVVTRFFAKTGAAAEFVLPAAPPRSQGDRPQSGYPAHVAMVGGALWVTMMTGDAGPFGTTTHRLDVNSAQWQTVRFFNPREVERIPPAALAGPTWPRRGVIANRTPNRTPEWICLEEPLPRDMNPHQPTTSYLAGEPGTGAVWRLGSTDLTRSDRAGAVRYPLNGIPALEGRTLSARSIAVDGRYVWVAGTAVIPGAPRAGAKVAAFLARFGRADHQWSSVDLTGLPEGAVPWRMLADGEGLWLLSPRGTFRLNRGGTGWQTASSVLGFESAVIQVRDIMPDGRYVWCVPTRANRADGAPGLLARWDRETGKTTWFDPQPGVAAEGLALLVENTRLWVSSSLGVHRLDRATYTWQRIPFPARAPSDFVWTPERIQYAESAIWFTDNATSVRWKEPVRPLLVTPTNP